MLDVKEYKSAAEMLAAYKARTKPKPALVKRMIPPPEPAIEEATEPVHIGEVNYIDVLKTGPKSVARLSALIKLVADAGGVTVDDIKSGRRHKEIVKARGVFFVVAYRYSLISGAQIAKYVDKDHTSGRYHNIVAKNHPEDYEPLLSNVLKRLEAA